MQKNKKSILFQLGRFGVGGVERVTVVLANELAKRGHSVCISAFELVNRNLLEGLDSRIRVYELSHGWLSLENNRLLRDIIKERKVTIVINQWCAPYFVTLFLRRAMQGSKGKLIAVNHNLPTTNKRIQDSSGLKRIIWKLITAINVRLVYCASDLYIVLSPSFIPQLKRFARIRRGDRILAIPNPLTLDISASDRKENLLIYVGRLEETQKKVSRVIEIWRIIADKLSDWKLQIVGDGPDRAKYEKLAAGLPRISFEGFKNPTEYYSKAKMLLLTSDFEGFGLVLIEAMSAGCVPIVLGSYSAAYDIVTDGGAIIESPFNARSFAETILRQANDSSVWSRYSRAAKKESERFSIKNIVDKWEDI